MSSSFVSNLGKPWETVRDRERPSVLQSMGSQRLGHDLATEQQIFIVRVCVMTVL